MAKILVIDDDEQLRVVLHRLLTSAGHVVTTACDGVDGLKCFRADPADLVITDIVMPDQEGLETIMSLRREQRGLGIIAISGARANSVDCLKIAGLLGAGCTLAKPFTLQQLKDAIAKVLSRSNPPGEAQ
jgi:DNA-binding response OmpR family regulator